MNNNYTNIDNIFDKARNLEPVLKDNEVRELISASTVNPVSTGIFNYGANKMTILSSMAALVISGLVLFNVIDSDKQVPENKQTSVEISTAKSTPNVKEILPDDGDKDINKRNFKPDDVAMNTYNVDDKVDVPNSSDKISGINTITLPNDYLDLYNIKFNSKTNNYEVTSGNMKVSIAPNMKTQFLSNSESSDTDHKLVPKLITSANGNVKIAFMTNKNNPEGSENKPNQVLYTETIEENTTLDIDILNQLSPAQIDSFLSQSSDTDNSGKFKVDRNKLSFLLNNSMNNSDVDSLRFKSKRIQIDFDDSENDRKVEQKIKIKRIDSEFDPLDTTKIDQILFMWPNTKLNEKITIPIEHFPHINKRIKMMTELTVNKLIPVRFDVPDGGADLIFWFEPTDELLKVVPENIKSRLQAEIAAINSSEDICKAAPETGSETIMDVWRSCSGAIENMLVYPNPTNGPVSVNFQLKEDRKVKLSIHDLTGKLLMTLSPETLIRKGEFRENFNLNKLTPGMYLLVAQTHYGEQTLQRIVIE
ncbi:MAG: hypothetical protein CVV22_06880 [Ignavibacteriae bacterium HGW-Ignavibacteriae-1]|jgi:hypothetical protein|nr:MAG: hypothetical protein CVV22_06880 [Ignavibacteriae bacterium HGW-Ignavibacteriae-1]